MSFLSCFYIGKVYERHLICIGKVFFLLGISLISFWFIVWNKSLGSGCLFWHIDSQNALSSSGNLAPVGNTETNDPKDAVGGIGDDPRGGFAVGGEVGIGEEVGTQFRALHAKRLEAVALTPLMAWTWMRNESIFGKNKISLIPWKPVQELGCVICSAWA